MVAPAVLVDFRRAPKLAVHRHQRAVQQTALVEVIEQRADGAVGRRQQLVFHHVKNAPMIVPILAGRLVEIKIHQRVRHPRLGQPPREQCLLPPRVRAVTLAHLERFAAEIKRPARRAARQHLRRALAVGIEPVGHARQMIHPAQQRQPIRQPPRRKALVQRQILRPGKGLRQTARGHARIHRLKRLAQLPRRAVMHAHSKLPALWHGHVTRQARRAPSAFLGHHRAHARVHAVHVLRRRVRTLERPARERHVNGRLVTGRPDKRPAHQIKFMHSLGQHRQMFRKPHARHARADVAKRALVRRGRLRFGIETFVMRQPALQKNHDDLFRRRLGLRPRLQQPRPHHRPRQRAAPRNPIAPRHRSYVQSLTHRVANLDESPTPPNSIWKPRIAESNQLCQTAHMTKAAEIIQEAEALPPAERSLVVDSLLQTLHKPDPAIDAQWAATAQRRLVELRSGQTKAVPGDEVFAKVRARFEK